MKFVGLAVLALAVLPHDALAQQRAQPPLAATAFDVFTDPQSFRNRRVTITGCQFFNAKSGTVNCAVRSPRGAQVGNILVELRSLDAPTRRRILTDCAGDGSDIADACERVTVTGRLSVRFDVLIEVVNASVTFD